MENVISTLYFAQCIFIPKIYFQIKQNIHKYKYKYKLILV